VISFALRYEAVYGLQWAELVREAMLRLSPVQAIACATLVPPCVDVLQSLVLTTSSRLSSDRIHEAESPVVEETGQLKRLLAIQE
jgi:hypothetical protein